MMTKIDISTGRYWDEGITLVSSCTRISPGCDNCWALAMEKRLKKSLVDDLVHFLYGIKTHPERLTRFNTRKPKVFAIWNDLFHEGVPDSFIEKVYMAMIDFSHNRYLILTKRPKRMAEWVKMNWANNCIYHGLTVCNQQEADEKIPIFLQAPGKKFLSIEPMLGAIDIESYLNQWQCPECHAWNHGSSFCDTCDKEQWENLGNNNQRGIDAVILGTETGIKRREMKTEWAESIVDQCDAAGVPLFIKQISINGKVSKDMSEWPEKLRRRELPWYQEESEVNK